MCGIAVAIQWDQAETTVRRLIDGMSHRGDISDPIATPSKDTAMGTRRLRIVDGEHAIQPQRSHDNRILVSFNGEIYNHEALRRELEACGIGFRTRSDTEVLACALSHWGARALGRLNGMYAFVALDLRTGKFLAARDPFGVKPLYLMRSDTGVLFSSEIRPLLAAVPTGDVLQLPPGHALTWTACTPFKSLQTLCAGTVAAPSPEVLDRLLCDAVHSRMPPDLPFALLVSGGIDSTLMAHYARQTGSPAPGYFLGGPTAPDYSYAAAYAESSGLDLRPVPIEADSTDMIGGVVETIESFEPDLVRNGLCTYLLARAVHADGYKVALSGDGADELFAGYLPMELAFADSDAAGSFVRDQHTDSLHRTSLQRLDRCGMRFQVEIREPFLDPAVAAYALGLGAAALLDTVGDAKRGKAPLRALYDRYAGSLPGGIRDRRKTPLNKGSGLDAETGVATWSVHAEETIPDQTFADGQQRFAAFDIRTKEEFLYLDSLAATMDVTRVPHLKERTRLLFPKVKNMRALNPYILDS